MAFDEPFDVPLNHREPLEVLYGLFSVPANRIRDDFFAKATAMYEEKSISAGLMDIAKTQGAEYNKLTFERIMSKLESWLKKKGQRKPLTLDEENRPAWWKHGVPIKVKKGKADMYGWLIEKGPRFEAVVYDGGPGNWIHLYGDPKSASFVEDGPYLPEAPVPHIRVKLALAKYPRPTLNVTDPDGRENFLAAFKKWLLVFTKTLTSMPGRDRNWKEYLSYQNWCDHGYPIIPVGWEDIICGKEEETPF